MTEEREPTVEELKAEEIPVEEEDTGPEKKVEQQDVAAALGELGKQFAETIQAAWNSQERKEFEKEVREGVRHFGDEVNKALREARESPTANRLKEEADEVRTRVESGDVARRARSGLVDGLHWLSQELARLSEQFSPPEKEPQATEEAEAGE